MTEPTAEQVSSERERAHALMEDLCTNPCSIWEGTSAAPGGHVYRCTAIATALARVRIEAHAAGRDEALNDAMETARDADCGEKHCTCSQRVEGVLRALRGVKP